MNQSPEIPNDRTPSPEALAIHVMRALTRAAKRGRSVTLEDLARDLEVRRADVRRVVSALDREGYVDALRMRPTLAGFALGQAGVGGLASLRSAPAATAAPRRAA